MGRFDRLVGEREEIELESGITIDLSGGIKELAPLISLMDKSGEVDYEKFPQVMEIIPNYIFNRLKQNYPTEDEKTLRKVAENPKYFPKFLKHVVDVVTNAFDVGEKEMEVAKKRFLKQGTQSQQEQSVSSKE